MSNILMQHGLALWPLYLVLGLLAAGLGEFVLRVKYANTYSLNRPEQQALAAVRWVASGVGCALLAPMNVPLWWALLLGAFTVTAGVDLQHRRLPWDAYLYGAVIAALGIGYLANGVTGFTQVLIAECLAFAVQAVFSLLGISAHGDTKVAMQFGAAMGHAVLLGKAVLLGYTLYGVPLIALYWLIRRRRLTHFALGPCLWVGAVMVPLLGRYL